MQEREQGAQEQDELLFLVGPTATGKTDLGVELARAHGLEVCSLDSMLVYRGMDIGTAKPTEAERGGVPHHLIDLVDPPERYDVQRFREDALAAARGIADRGSRALFVGGTGLYLQVLVHGLFDGPAIDRALRARLEERGRVEGGEVLYRELMAVDPTLARRLHPNDARRVIRGLEVFEQTGTPLSTLQSQWASGAPRPARIVGLDPEREAWEAKVRARTDAMLAAGWIDEVRAIVDGPGFGPTSRQALGYAEILAHLAGELERDALPELVARRTRQFARRQRTWYRRFDDIAWMPHDLEGIARVAWAATRLGLA